MRVNLGYTPDNHVSIIVPSSIMSSKFWRGSLKRWPGRSFTAPPGLARNAAGVRRAAKTPGRLSPRPECRRGVKSQAAAARNCLTAPPPTRALTAVPEDGISPVKEGAGVIGLPPAGRGPPPDWLSPGHRLGPPRPPGGKNPQLPQPAAAGENVAAVLLKPR